MTAPAPTPAPVAVPEGGLCDVRGPALVYPDRESTPLACRFPHGHHGDHESDDGARWGDWSRPEPVTAPLPSEEVEAAWGEFRDGPDYQPTDRYDVRSVFEAGFEAGRLVPEEDEERPCLCGTPGAADGWCPVHGGALAREATLAQHIRRLVARLPEDDEDTVRVPRSAVERLRVALDEGKSLEAIFGAASSLFPLETLDGAR